MAGVLAVFCHFAATFFMTILFLKHSLQRSLTLTSRLTPIKVKVTCAAAWAANLILTAVPLASGWRYFGQQTLCAPLHHKRDSSLESHNGYGAMVLLHLTMCAVCSVCEVVHWTCRRVTKSSIMNKDTRTSVLQFVMFGSLISGFLYTITCVVPTDTHTERQMATHTAVVYFGGVVTCSMNSYLYLCGVRVERAKRIKEQRLIGIVSRVQV